MIKYELHILLYRIIWAKSMTNMILNKSHIQSIVYIYIYNFLSKGSDLFYNLVYNQLFIHKRCVFLKRDSHNNICTNKPCLYMCARVANKNKLVIIMSCNTCLLDKNKCESWNYTTAVTPFITAQDWQAFDCRDGCCLTIWHLPHRKYISLCGHCYFKNSSSNNICRVCFKNTMKRFAQAKDCHLMWVCSRYQFLIQTFVICL